MPHWSYICRSYTCFFLLVCLNVFMSTQECMLKIEIPWHVVPYEEFNMCKILFQYCKFFLYFRIDLTKIFYWTFWKEDMEKACIFWWKVLCFLLFCFRDLWIGILKFYHLRLIFCEYYGSRSIIAIYLQQERGRIDFSQLIKIPQWFI